MKEIDWEQRRYEIAKDMLCSIYREETFEASKDLKCAAMGAILFADTLIEELKKKDKQMKATELKINDWILAGGEPVQIQDVCVENSTLTVYDDKTNKIEEYSYDELMPIPLTSEILEKNEWEEDIDKYGYTYYQHNGWYRLSMAEQKGPWVFSHYDDFLTTIQSVHQLQHLLWALGMDDDLKI